jgi:hypothetical protein
VCNSFPINLKLFCLPAVPCNAGRILTWRMKTGIVEPELDIVDKQWLSFHYNRLHCSPVSHRRQRKGKSRMWDSKIWSRVLWDSDPKMTALARASSNCKWETRHLCQRERPTSTNPQLSDNKNLVISPRWLFIPTQTGRLTVGRNIRLRTGSWSCSMEHFSFEVPAEELRHQKNCDQFSWALKVGQWRGDFACGLKTLHVLYVVQWYWKWVIQSDCYSSCVKIHFQETDSGG